MNHELQTYSLHIPNTSCLKGELYALLSSQEQDRAQRLCIPEKKEQFIITRGVLRLLLSQQLNISAHDIAIQRRHSGKPFVQSSPKLHFNISHSFEYAVFALSDHNVGIDIEYCDPTFDVQASLSFLHPKEKSYLRQKDYDQALFFELWTHKEAWGKLHGDLTHEDWSNWTVPTDHPRISLEIHRDYKATCFQRHIHKHHHHCLTTYSLKDLLKKQ
ncbi:MAG: 4'-phosphopantetheinyl transferase superfamily protein [Mariprofundaceae bacterium]|nr:4'-phosphopantetheinyl transferase superfamily protein [Mariprofundaceae bacterium]